MQCYLLNSKLHTAQNKKMVVNGHERGQP